MDHYSYLRRDVAKKFRNASCDVVRQEQDSPLAFCVVLKCPDFFGLSGLLREQAADIESHGADDNADIHPGGHPGDMMPVGFGAISFTLSE